MAESFVVGPEDVGTRLDRFLAARLPDVSRSLIRRWLDSGHVSIEGVSVKPSLLLREGCSIRLDRPRSVETRLVPEPIDLRIVHEDDAIVVIDKPAGLTVHPGAGRSAGTLVNGLLHRYPDRDWPGDPERPGIVHRLDRKTSGLLVVALDAKAYFVLRRQIAEHSSRRAYVALVWGTPEPAVGVIAGRIGRDPQDRKKMAVVRRGGRPARTHYRLLHPFERVSLLEVRLETGRTHQIRVHMAHAGFPVFGDETYGGGKAFLRRLDPKERPLWFERLRRLNRQALHAYHLSFRHPHDGKRWVFESPVPFDIDALLRELTPSGQGER